MLTDEEIVAYEEEVSAFMQRPAAQWLLDGMSAEAVSKFRSAKTAEELAHAKALDEVVTLFRDQHMKLKNKATYAKSEIQKKKGTR